MPEIIRICYIVFILDTSGSMGIYQSNMITAILDTLKKMADANKTNVDIEFRCMAITFNSNTHKIVDSPVPPEQLAELIDDKALYCNGGTNISAAVKYINSLFSRSSPLFKACRTGDPMPFTVIVTDFRGTDNPDERAKAIQLVRSNRLFTDESNTLCVFVGSEDDKAEAVALAGDEKNIVSIEPENLERLLTPVIREASMIVTDPTHIGKDENQSPSETAKGVEEHEAAGSTSADQLSNDESIEELIRRLLDL